MNTEPRPRRSALLAVALLAVQSGLALAVVYLLGLLAAAWRREEDSIPTRALDSHSLRLVVLVPAHDEEDGIEEGLAALDRCDYPPGLRRTIVIADNCSDRTAERARRAGAEVWERHNPDQKGKGHALAWALARVDREVTEADGVIILDADCIPSANLLQAVDDRLRRGARVLQVDYLVANPEDSSVSALRFAAFALINTVRGRGKHRLGLSCGLFGTGMAFRRELLRDQPWTDNGLAEDGEYHMRLVLAGERVEFAAEASVTSPMPTTPRASTQQQLRWEGGKLAVIRRWAPRLLGSGLSRRDPVRIHAGLESLVPPQSLIAAGSAGSLLAGVALRRRGLLALSLGTLAAQLAFVLGGLRLVGAPPVVYRALLRTPALIAAKLAIYARLLSGRGPTSWMRTERETQP
jgi:1,2-diacylglycerol 3-beta-glucosyltransferase